MNLWEDFDRVDAETINLPLTALEVYALIAMLPDHPVLAPVVDKLIGAIRPKAARAQMSRPG